MRLDTPSSPGEKARRVSAESPAELSAPFPSALGEAPRKPARPHSPAPRPSPVRGRGGRAGLGRAGQGEGGLKALAMLPSALYWDLVGSSALLNLPAAPGFGNLGKSFLIENLLRAGAPPSPAQLRPLPASPVPLKLCPAAEQISPSGGPYPTRWAFQVLNPAAADSGRLPARAPAAERGGVFPPAATGERRPRPASRRRGDGAKKGLSRRLRASARRGRAAGRWGGSSPTSPEAAGGRAVRRGLRRRVSSCRRRGDPAARVRAAGPAHLWA